MRIARQMIRLIDNHHLELLLGSRVHLLCLGYFFEKVLDDDPVVIADVRGRDFEVVNRGYDVEFQLSV